jgi:hypothetical protein
VPVPAASQERVDHLCRREPAGPRDGPAEDAGALGQVLHVHHVGVERVRELDVVAARAFTRLGLPFEVGTGFLSDPGRDHDEAAVVHHVGRYDRPWCDRSTAGLGPGAVPWRDIRNMGTSNSPGSGSSSAATARSCGDSRLRR